MNFKKTIVSVLASTMVLNIGIGAYATSEVEKNEDIIKMAIETQVSQGENVKMTPLTEAQIAQIKLDAAKKIEKWEVLSAAEKQEMYNIAEESREALKELVEKYVELDLIEKEEADKIIEQIKIQSATMQEDGKMPMSPIYGITKGKGEIKAATVITDSAFEEMKSQDNSKGQLEVIAATVLSPASLEEGKNSGVNQNMKMAKIENTKGFEIIPLTKSEIEQIKLEEAARLEKWEKLSEANKQDVYKIVEKSRNAQIKSIEKAVEFDLIKLEEADKMIELIKIKSATEKQEGKMPLMHINSFNGKQSATTMAIPSTHEELNPLIHEEAKPSNHERIKPSTHEGVKPSTHEGVKPSNHERIKPSNHEGVNKNVKTH